MAMAASRTTALAAFTVGIVLVVGAAGCSGDQHDALVDPAQRSGAGAIPGWNPQVLPGIGDVAALRSERFTRFGNPYFPIIPGAYSDYRVTRLGVGERYVRISVGSAETFFSRSAMPFVYGDVPGHTRDSTLFGLREFYSLSPDGAVWFHGAQNNGFMSHTAPPVRILLADAKPGDAWVDSVFFESFLPGMVPFFQNYESHTWTVSEPARLPLPGGVFQGLRTSSVIDDLPLSSALRGAMGMEARPGPGDDAWRAFTARGLAATPEPLRGIWLSRHEGMVARDWPSGQGEVNLNAVTFELIGRGTGPVPPPTPPPIDTGTQ